MPEYKCFRCGHATHNKSYMRMHLNRLYPCEPNIRDINLDHYRNDILHRRSFDETPKNFKTAPNGSKTAQIGSKTAPNGSTPILSETEIVDVGIRPLHNECHYCGQSYKYRRNLQKHMHKCVAKIEQDRATSDTYKLIDRLNAQLKHQQQQIDALTQINSIATSNSHNNMSNSHNNVQVIINVDKNRNNYKDTDYSVLSDQDIQHAIKHAGRCIQEIIPMTHFNKSYPQNQNIYISCLKSAVAMMFEDEKWNACGWSDIADKFIDDNTQTLQGWMDGNSDEYPELAAKFKMFIQNKEYNDRFVVGLKKDIKMMLYNNRKLIHSDEMVNLLQTLDNDGAATDIV